jgi:hypothetical protein
VRRIGLIPWRQDLFHALRRGESSFVVVAIAIVMAVGMFA